MRLNICYVAVLGAVASASQADFHWDKPLVESRVLQSLLKLDDLMDHAKALESIAFNTTARNRVMGSPGDKATVKYIYDRLTDVSLKDYYNVTLQEFSFRLSENATGTLYVNGKNTSIRIGDYSPSGTVNGSLALVNNLGCNETDYPSPITGKVALISRGICNFADKSGIAGKMGAVAAVIYNNAPPGTGPITLYENASMIWPTLVPTVSISGTEGTSLADAIKSGNAPSVALKVNLVIRDGITNNVFAQTRTGSQDNILQLGAHSDSVAAGPGIEDNGSGVSALIEIAKHLSSYRIRNSVRFTWWGGEETGLRGSRHFVENLTAAEKKKIRLYLNFDMIASPNYQYEIFDGNGDAFNKTGPPGSELAEELFEDYFESRKLNYTATAFDGRTDYEPFLEADIAVGGLFTGADANKTKDGVAQWGGWEGKILDPNYHQPGDVVANINTTAFLVNAQAIAHAVATYSRSFGSLHSNKTVIRRRATHPTGIQKRSMHSDTHPSSGGCGGGAPHIGR
ncbi:putative aminopeptidase y [Venturia nashicola]|uniref:Peptide hydrolase n=1 Tax=Venturia nashicola TaxID=86259 RepID=A0A4Z1PEF0_9PEZI|nr:putative aminopeptidase y [Venturia nashicola]